MGQIKRKAALLLLLCMVMSLSGCGKDTKDDSGEKGVSAGDTFSLSEKPEDGLMQSLAAAVQILAENFQGSGILYADWEDKAVLVTAAHVIPAECKEIQVTFKDGQAAVCTDYQLLEDVDCAFLFLPDESLPKDWQEKYGVVKKDRERFDAMSSDEGVFVADYQADNDLGCRFAMIIDNWIYVEDFATHMMLLSGEARGGMSGSGVFEEDGCFLGILCGSSENGELAVLPYSIIETNFTKLLEQNY